MIVSGLALMTPGRCNLPHCVNPCLANSDQAGFVLDAEGNVYDFREVDAGG